MRIGIDAYPLTVQGGGIRRYTECLVRGLMRTGAEHEYTLYRGDERSCRELPVVPPLRLDPLAHPLRGVSDHLWIPGASGWSDLYHGTNYFSPLMNQVPTVLTIHDLSVQLLPDQHPLSRRAQHRMLPWMCRRARRIIADSESTRRDLIRVFGIPESKIRVIHLAVGESFRPIEDTDRLEAVRQRYRLPESFVLFLGAIEPRKNLPALIRAMGLVSQRGLRTPLVLAGAGNARYLQGLTLEIRRAGLELGRDVIFTGFVPEGDLAALYNLSEMFVYPSTYEGFGLPPLEAMACGTPAVVARNSSLEEVYSDCGMMTEVTPDALRDAVIAIRETPSLRRSLIELGLKRARKRSWDSVVRETLSVYREALGGS